MRELGAHASAAVAAITQVCGRPHAHATGRYAQLRREERGVIHVDEEASRFMD